MKLWDLGSPVRTHLVPATWPYDKHPDMPELKAHAMVTLLDAEGPGVVTNIHASHYLVDSGMGDDVYEKSAPVAAQVMLRVYYDGHTEPDICLPFFDFLGDPGCEAAFYAVRRFSKVPMSHNFRLEMPFARHIRITLENPTGHDLMGYTDVQYDERPNLAPGCGYLYVQRREGKTVIPGQPIELFAAEGRGCIAAHWFCVSGQDEGFENGEGLCEANCEFYMDGADRPVCEYLGVEDLYGYSWGFKQLHSDGFAAILRKDALHPGARVAMLRCREEDAVRYTEQCRVVMDYSQEYFSPFSTNPIHTQHPVFAPRRRYTAPIEYKTCWYYYKQP